MKTATYKDCLLQLGILVLSLLLPGSCFDNEQTGNGAEIRFNVYTEDDDTPAICPASGIIACTTNFATGSVTRSATDTVFLIEHEEAFSDHTGIRTRAEITTNIEQKFSTIGYRGATSGAAIGTTPWFHNAETNANGTLVIPVYWGWAYRYARFHAIYPYTTNSPTDKIRLSPENYASTPYVDFEVEPGVPDQKDLMTACSGEVHYATQGVHPQTDLRFRHALTAVRFRVGPNLSWDKNITKVEIINARSKGRYTLSTAFNGSGAAWSNLSDPETFTLGGISVPLKEHVDSLIIGRPGDSLTFYMIPQSLTGVSVKIYFDNNPTPAIAANLAGTWKPGTMKTYTLSLNASTWQYHLNVTSPAPVDCSTTSTDYTIQSYREDPTGMEKQPVAWRVVSYRESTNGGVSWHPETTTKPAWLTSLKDHGTGSTTGETGKATLALDVIEHHAPYNLALRNAPQKGGEGNYYDLSTHDLNGGSTSRNTANSYLISAPGWYKIPLVYGNAIKNGMNNPSAYRTYNTGARILRNFKDHAGQNITNPWITQSNGGANVPDGARIVWTDQSGIVTGLGLEGSGTDAFVHFQVPQSNIRNGNAVIAVTKGGTVVWSWHLWFAKEEELNTTACTNFQNVVYEFANLTFGFAWRKWVESTYDNPRIARVKVEQTVANNGVKQFAYIYIRQNNGTVKGVSSTLYQWGRKDALPGVATVSDGSFIENGGDNMSIQNGIQHPETFYTWVNDGSWTANYNYYNLWSMDNTTVGYNDNPVVKTVYDPCPAGFHIPASNAFTGFTFTGNSEDNDPSQFNVSGGWDYGWHFNNRINFPDDIIYFPASGCRNYVEGERMYVDTVGYSWAALPESYITHNRCALSFRPWNVGAKYKGNPADAFHIRPVKE